MPHLTPAQVADIGARGQFAELVGTVEDHQIEAKAEPYTDNNHGRLELAKDVSGFANAGGGVIIIGARTERLEAHRQDEIREVREFVHGLVNTEQYHDIIRAWIYPPPQGVDIRWYPSANIPDRGIVLIIVPKQPDEERPFLIAHTVDAERGRVRDIVFGYAERRRTNTEPLGVRDLQELLRAGRRFGEIGPRLDRMEELLKRRPAEVVQPERPEALPAPAVPPQPAPRDSFAVRREQAMEAVGLQQQPAVVLAAIPERPIEIPRSFGGRGSPVYDLLAEPPSLRDGSFLIGGSYAPIIVRGEVYRSSGRGEVLEVWEDGTVLAAGEASDRLCWGTRQTEKEPLRMNPLALSETIYLFVELTRRLLSHARDEVPPIQYVVSFHRMAAVGQRALLAPGPRRGLRLSRTREAPGENAEFSFTWPGPGAPDVGRVSYWLLRRIYLWFGFNEDQIPYVIDGPDGQRVISPEAIIADGRPP